MEVCESSQSTGDEVLSQMCMIAEAVETLDANKEVEKVNEQNDLSVSNKMSNSSFKDSRPNEDELNVKSKTCVEYLFEKSNVSQISRACKEFKYKNGQDCFLKGCKWSPDGSCILTNSEDKKLRIFDLPQELFAQKVCPKNKLLPDLKSTLQVGEGGRVYDYCWYPLMNSWSPESCCFFSSAADEPVHLWDAYTSQLRATYKTVNYADEIMSPLSLCADTRGEKLFCGFNNKVDVFDIAVPGARPLSFDFRDLKLGHVSAIAVNPDWTSLVAVGTYQKVIALFSREINTVLCTLRGHNGGLTHMIFSPDGPRLFSGSRNDPEIICWDLRQPGKVLFSLDRTVTTNQRIYFDITPDGKHIVSGNTDGTISAWNLDSIKNMSDEEPIKPDFKIEAHNDCTNGVSINQHYPFLATSSGQRHYPEINDENGDDCVMICDDEIIGVSDSTFDHISLSSKRENCIKLWWVGANA